MKRTRKGFRLVRIDSKTWIEVGPDKTDEEAATEWIEKYEWDSKNKLRKLKT